MAIRDGLSSDEQAAGAAVRAVAAAGHPYPSGRFDGRGIVVCAGGARLFTCAWVGLWILRRTLGCTLPIEVWHLGETELGPSELALLDELGVVTVDALAVRADHPARLLGGWELKSFALANCRFREVMLLDADNVAIRDPAFLFESGPYLEAGAVFWPDVTRLSPDSAIWEICGLDCRNEPAWESGQIVLDKSRCWPALQVARHLNDHSDVFYRHLYGDKDTFHIAWRMLEQPCSLPRRARATEYGLLQHDFEGHALFQHRNQSKWALAGENPVDRSFHHGQECLVALADLQARWSGRIDLLPERSSADRSAEAELAAMRLFRLERRGSDRCVIELLPGNLIGEGRTEAWLRWYVANGTLTLAGRPGPTARLTRQDEETWQGRSVERGLHAMAMRRLEQTVSDPVSSVVAALVQRVAADRLDAEAAASALATLDLIADMTEVLAREQTRWPSDSAASRAIDAARWRLGRRNPGIRARDGGDARRYERL